MCSYDSDVCVCARQRRMFVWVRGKMCMCAVEMRKCVRQGCVCAAAMGACDAEAFMCAAEMCVRAPSTCDRSVYV